MYHRQQRFGDRFLPIAVKSTHCQNYGYNSSMLSSMNPRNCRNTSFLIINNIVLLACHGNFSNEKVKQRTLQAYNCIIPVIYGVSIKAFMRLNARHNYPTNIFVVYVVTEMCSTKNIVF